MSFSLYQCINVDRILMVIENNTKGRNITVKHTGKYNLEQNYRITFVPLLFL